MEASNSGQPIAFSLSSNHYFLGFYEDRHHLLPHIRRKRRRRYRASASRLAARGHDIHFITYSQPFRLTGREANIPATTRFRSRIIRSSSTLPMTSPSPPAWPKSPSSTRSTCCTSTTPYHTASSALLARQMLAARGKVLPLHYDAPRDRHHPRRPRPLLPSHHPFRHQRVRRRHRHLQLSPRPHP